MEGRLFVVSTPIGNMGDFSFRAVEVLRSVALVLAEDTRHSRALLARYEIDTPMASYHEHREAAAAPGIIRRILGGEDVALISDAGTPLLSDPGARLVQAAIEAGVDTVPIPGASALLAALAASGIDSERFTFYGFLARRGRERREALAEIAGLAHTAVLYEAPPRVARTLAEIVALSGESRPAVVARELTKQFEEFRRGTAGELAAYYEGSPPRGEVVIVLAAAERSSPAEDMLREEARALRAEGRAAREIVTLLVQRHGAARNVAYRLAHEDV
ncbi:MAG: 16S rRNA (cytidine(1402)-2'-O)-methyltransferase [Gemmatimonadaceae bacterium]